LGWWWLPQQKKNENDVPKTIERLNISWVVVEPSLPLDVIAVFGGLPKHPKAIVAKKRATAPTKWIKPLHFQCSSAYEKKSCPGTMLA
jgi:hypothetical protein